MMPIKKLVVILWVIMFCADIGSADEKPATNYCDDKAVWEEWDKIVRQCPLDVPLQILHALRIGLCVKVENGSIAFNEATDLMNENYDMLIQKRGDEERRLKKQAL